jgi:prepilin-type N-terminal cleavage/methylation domain-containing protein
MKQYGEKAFTLIELSIVLVIIGLITGGILTGQTLIAAARVRSMITQLDRFNLAVTTFRGKYDCLPATCTNPSSFGLKSPVNRVYGLNSSPLAA